MLALWKRIEPIGLFAAGLVTLAEALVALPIARESQYADVGALFALGGLLMFLAGLLVTFRVRGEAAEAILGALTGGAFAVSLVDLNLKGFEVEGRYGSLMPAFLVGA